MQNASPDNIIGPDINEYRGDVNYTLLATRTPYCYLRASGSGTGRFRVDTKFFEYVRGLRSVGILTGAYHYAVPSNDLTTADSQCDNFINLLQEAYGPGKYGELMPVIDVETPRDKSISTDTLLDWVDRFRKRFERKTRRRLMIYTGSFFIELYNNFYHSRKGYILSDMPLWIAMYPELPGNPPYPRDAGGWTRWLLWQFTENGEMAGIQPPVDLNYGPTNLDYLTQPRDVQNLKAYGDDRNIYVSWDRNTDVDLNGYNIFLNSEYVGTVGKNATSHTIRLDHPNKNARYEVGVEAFDVTGDFSQNRAKTIVMLRHTYDRDNYIDNKNAKLKCSCQSKNYKESQPIVQNNYKKFNDDIEPKGYIKDCSCYKKHTGLNYNEEQKKLKENMTFSNYDKGYSDYKKDIIFDNFNKEYDYYSNYRKPEIFNPENVKYNKLNKIYEDYNCYKGKLNDNNHYRNKYEIYYDESDDLYYYPVKLVHPQSYMEKRSRNKEEYSPLFKYNLEEEEIEFDDFEYVKEFETQVYNEWTPRRVNMSTMDYGEEFEFVRSHYDDDFEDDELNNYSNFHFSNYSPKQKSILENYNDYEKNIDEGIDENRSDLYALYNYSEEDYTEYERHIDEEYDFDIEYNLEIEDKEDLTRGVEDTGNYEIEEDYKNGVYEYEHEYKKQTTEKETVEEYSENKSENEIDICNAEENQDRTPCMENESEDEGKRNAESEATDDINRGKEKELKECDDKYHYQYLKEDKKTIEDCDDAHYKHWYENNNCKGKGKKKKKKGHKKHKR
ncbi:hypothetical protein UT300018_18320 [Clostridium faecium]|uniref:Lysozyme n=1 Tax=Clostridium faecium TaxID=2762223 RepID=A0ABR8YSZ6_9CLOT|nr:hypothetical protein [Clostridium faecium]